MPFKTSFAAAVALAAAAAAVATPASARPGCRQGDRLGSDNASRGINANAPSRAILNPCSSMYRGGVNVRRMEKRRYPDAIVRH